MTIIEILAERVLPVIGGIAGGLIARHAGLSFGDTLLCLLAGMGAGPVSMILFLWLMDLVFRLRRRTKKPGGASNPQDEVNKTE